MVQKPNIADWLPEGHLAQFVSEVVDQLDLRAIFASYENGDERGQPPYHPGMMLKLLMYGYCTGKPSSRKIEKATWEEVAYRVLSEDQHPDHDSIADFRKRHLLVLPVLFLQVLKLCRAAGLVTLGHVALDGTKVKANASKHKAMSYDRMGKAEAQLEKEIADLLQEAACVDKDEDARYGVGTCGDELPKDLQRRESRLLKIRAAKAQKNFTDPESRIMKDGASKRFEQAYNAQIVVDSTAQIIVAEGITQETNDKKQLLPMMAKVEDEGRTRGLSVQEGDCGTSIWTDQRSPGFPSVFHAGFGKGSSRVDIGMPDAQFIEVISERIDLQEIIRVKVGLTE